MPRGRANRPAGTAVVDLSLPLSHISAKACNEASAPHAGGKVGESGSSDFGARALSSCALVGCLVRWGFLAPSKGGLGNAADRAVAIRFLRTLITKSSARDGLKWTFFADPKAVWEPPSVPTGRNSSDVRMRDGIISIANWAHIACPLRRHMFGLFQRHHAWGGGTVSVVDALGILAPRATVMEICRVDGGRRSGLNSGQHDTYPKVESAVGDYVERMRCLSDPMEVGEIPHPMEYNYDGERGEVHAIGNAMGKRQCCEQGQEQRRQGTMEGHGRQSGKTHGQKDP